MSGFDYIHCEECCTRLLYDGDEHLRQSLEEEGHAGIVCPHCVKKLKKKIEVLKKHDRRRH